MTSRVRVGSVGGTDWARRGTRLGCVPLSLQFDLTVCATFDGQSGGLLLRPIMRGAVAAESCCTAPPAPTADASGVPTAAFAASAQADVADDVAAATAAAIDEMLSGERATVVTVISDTAETHNDPAASTVRQRSNPGATQGPLTPPGCLPSLRQKLERLRLSQDRLSLSAFSSSSSTSSNCSSCSCSPHVQRRRQQAEVEDRSELATSDVAPSAATVGSPSCAGSPGRTRAPAGKSLARLVRQLERAANRAQQQQHQQSQQLQFSVSGSGAALPITTELLASNSH